MDYPLTGKQFSGLFRRYSDTGHPSLELFPSSTADDRYAKYIFWYNQTDLHFCSGLWSENPYLVIKISDFPFVLFSCIFAMVSFLFLKGKIKIICI